MPSIAEFIAAKSDQLNADDLISPVNVRIEAVAPNDSDGNHRLALWTSLDAKRPWKPSKGMLSVMGRLWGEDYDLWVGHHVTIFNDPHVMYGGKEVGGIRISHADGITETRTLSVKVARGKKVPWVVEPLSVPASPTVADVEACDDEAVLRSMWDAADEHVRAAIRARVTTLRGGDAA